MEPTFELTVSGPLVTSRREAVLAAFEGLISERALEVLLSVPEEAASLLSDFQFRYRQGFDWSPLDKKTDGLRVLVTKRGAQPRTISSFLGTDHHRLTGYWEEFLGRITACELSYETLFRRQDGHRFATVDRLSQFIFGLRRHIKMEEDEFFPLFEHRKGTSDNSGPTAVMRAEHREIESILGKMETLLRAGDCATVIQTIEGQPVHPSSLFRSHDAKEETVLYPMADRLFTQQEKDDLCFRMQKI